MNRTRILIAILLTFTIGGFGVAEGGTAPSEGTNLVLVGPSG